jgi:hypothetical protein
MRDTEGPGGTFYYTIGGSDGAELDTYAAIPYNGLFGVWKAVSILAVLALLGLWAAGARRR